MAELRAKMFERISSDEIAVVVEVLGRCEPAGPERPRCGARGKRRDDRRQECPGQLTEKLRQEARNGPTYNDGGETSKRVDEAH